MSNGIHEIASLTGWRRTVFGRLTMEFIKKNTWVVLVVAFAVLIGIGIAVS